MNSASSELRDRAGCELIAQSLRAGREIRLRVTGTSMLPAVRPGDVLRVRPKTSAEVGQIAVFERDGRLFAHRVIAQIGAHGRPQLITRGDALAVYDPPVRADEMLGEVATIIRDGRIVPAGIGETALWVRAVSLAIRRLPRLAGLALRLNSIRLMLLARGRSVSKRTLGDFNGACD
jgi:hypothetical protein